MIYRILLKVLEFLFHNKELKNGDIYESKNYKFTFNIRNKQASGDYPTHMMCDYKKKKAGKISERPQDGGADYAV